jgi:hypothetical protein
MNHDVTHQISGITSRPKAKSTAHRLRGRAQLAKKTNILLPEAPIGVKIKLRHWPPLLLSDIGSTTAFNVVA